MSFNNRLRLIFVICSKPYKWLKLHIFSSKVNGQINEKYLMAPFSSSCNTILLLYLYSYIFALFIIHNIMGNLWLQRQNHCLCKTCSVWALCVFLTDKLSSLCSKILWIPEYVWFGRIMWKIWGTCHLRTLSSQFGKLPERCLVEKNL